MEQRTVISCYKWNKKAKDIIFVGNKEDTLDAMTAILQSRTQWTDFMESTLRIITINQSNVINTDMTCRTMNNSLFPFKICDIIQTTDISGFLYMLVSLQ